VTENRYDYVLSHNHVDHITEEKALKLIVFSCSSKQRHGRLKTFWQCLNHRNP